MNIYLSTLCCNENHYLREWVEYYKNLGVTKIFLWDNTNNDYDDKISDVIGDYINNGYVITRKNPDKWNQMELYNIFYNEYKNEFDWCCFFDCDEYLYIGDYNTIEDFIIGENLNDNHLIYFHWRMMDDGEYIYPQYTYKVGNESIKELFDNHNSSSNLIIKIIIKGGLDNIGWGFQPHCPVSSTPENFSCVILDGDSWVKAPLGVWMMYTNSILSKYYLLHYRERSLFEFITHRNSSKFPINGCYFKDLLQKICINRFFGTNNVTKLKCNLIKKIAKIYRPDPYFLDKFDENDYFNKKKKEDMENLTIWCTTHDENLINEDILNHLQVKDKMNLSYKIYNTADDELNKYLCEWCTFRYVFENQIKSEYIGFMHYRRGFYDIPKVLNEDRCFVQMGLYTVNRYKDYTISLKEHFEQEHNSRDLNFAIDFIDRRFGPNNLYSKYLRQESKLIIGNNFIMSWNKFEKLYKFISPIIDAYVKEYNLDWDATKFESYYRDLYDKQILVNKDDNFDYQKRSLAFMIERLVTAFIFVRFKPENIIFCGGVF